MSKNQTRIRNTCVTCKHGNKTLEEHPCNTCDGKESNWEAE